MSSDRWKNVAEACYFALTGMLAFSIPLFIVGSTLLGYFLAAVAILVALAVYSIIQTINLQSRMLAWSTKYQGRSAEAVTILSTLIIVVLAWISYSLNSLLMSSVFIGGTGGLVHEIAQSNGKFILPHKDSSGVFLGGLFGLVVGGVAGLVLVQGLAETSVSLRIVGEAFLAGLGLKGVADAITTTRPNGNTGQTNSGSSN